jgi:hypothetical protein
MTTKKLHSLGLGLACALLGSCLGGGGAGDESGTGGAPGSCEFITGGGSTVTHDSSKCFDCSVTDDSKAADGDLTTYATVSVPTSFTQQGASIRATAQLGLVFPAGQRASVYFISPTSGGFNPPDTSVTLTTYLDGQKQEDGSSYQTVLADPANGKPYTFKGFVTGKAFDAVEVMVSNTELASGAWKINEICSDATPPQ